MTIDIDHLRTWIGRQETATDLVGAAHMDRFHGMLDRDEMNHQVGDPLPPSAHWTLFNPVPKASRTGPDGHPERGDFLPPVDLPRRMWAGSRLEFPGILRVGDEASRTSTVTDVSHKQGKSGNLVFVVVRHEISGPDGLAITDEHDIVYRDAADPAAPQPPAKPAPEGAVWSRTVDPDPVLLFRYSALTFNGHRIHYDLPYVTEEEGYPGLIVHGPLIATLLMDLCRRQRPDAKLTQFSFRAMSPLFHTAPFTVNAIPADDGASARVWAATPDGGLAMQADARFGS